MPIRRLMVTVGILSFFLSLISLSSPAAALRQKLEVRQHLKRLNKPPVKSIKSPDGDIIDCISISRQPAFDHPFLKNHTIQLRPNYHPEGLYDVSNVLIKPKERPITQLWHEHGKCAPGTIPVRRTKEDDLYRASSVTRYGRKKRGVTPQPKSVEPNLTDQTKYEHAIVYVRDEKYYGAKATINVWKPKIQQHYEYSTSQMYVLAGSIGVDLNSIEAGWQVSPNLYGDNNTRLFTSWTSDAYRTTGCYDLLCSGFIQISNEIALGATLSPLSIYGDSQYEISILVWKDPRWGNWCLRFGDNHVVGYWPAVLFSLLNEGASTIEWGGEVMNSQINGQHSTTQMGSGHFPEEGFGKSSYFKNIQVVGSSNNLKVPTGINTYTEQSKCYDVRTGSTDDWGHYFYYGGPGRNPDCP